jgi:excisionase family DNA binding protein
METQEAILEKAVFAGGGMDRYFNTKELSDYLRIPEQTIRRWVLKNEIAYIRIHNIIRFRLSEIEKWIDGKRDNAPALPESEYELFSGTENVSLTEALDNSQTAQQTGETA